jgi:hypothetical protein
VPSWFVSSWSKILRASTSCDVVPAPEAAVLPDASLDVAPVVDVDGDRGDVDGAVDEGAAVDCDGVEDGAEVAPGALDDDVDCASIVADADESLADGVAPAVPAVVVRAAAPAAIASFLSKEFIATLLSFEGRRIAAGDCRMMQIACRDARQ